MENNIQPQNNEPMPPSPMPPTPPAQPMPMPTPPPIMPSAPSKRKFSFNTNTLVIVVTVLVVLALAMFVAYETGLTKKIPFLNFSSSQSVAQTAVAFLNNNKATYLNGQTATLGTVSVVDGVVKFQINIGGSSYDSYVTQNGQLLFPNAIDLGAASKTAAAQPQAQTVDINNVNIAGEPFVGSATAPVTMAFWSDYQCPFCKQVVEQTFPQLMANYVNTGKLKIVFKDYAFLGADSQVLGQFARAVWAADPSGFGAWHQAIYDGQGTENTGWATQTKIMQITTQSIGAANAQKALALYQANGAAYQKSMDADKAEGTSFGVNGTPGTIIGTQFINGAEPYATFKAAIDTALAGK